MTYKFQRWLEDNDRIKVDAHYAQAEMTLSPLTKLRVVGLIDTISGASPSGQPAPTGETQVPLSQLTDRREAGQLEVAHQFERLSLTLGYADSRESDYISKAWSVSTQTNFNNKNTLLQIGYAAADDEIEAAFFDSPRFKQTDDVIIGLTQVLSPQTQIIANFSYGRAQGYMNDPYKLVGKSTEILPGFSLDLTFPENRPQEKTKWIGYFAVNHAFEAKRAALEASWRWLNDSWGAQSHTVELAWFQRFGERLIIRPSVRYYEQTAADFYFPDLNRTTITPSPEPRGSAPFYSADYRLSNMRTWMLGLNAVWEINAAWKIDATYERYLMRGLDGLTSPSAYSDANVLSLGIHYSW